MECCKMVCKNDKVGFWCVKMTFFYERANENALSTLDASTLRLYFLIISSVLTKYQED